MITIPYSFDVSRELQAEFAFLSLRSFGSVNGKRRIETKTGKTIMAAIRWIVGAALFAMFAAPVFAQQFPNRPIVLVIPYAAGGNVDISVRALQAGLGDSLDQPVIVENRPGAGGTIAGDYVARSTPDGHTLFVGSNGPVMLGPMTMPKPPYQWQQAFAPVSTLKQFPIKRHRILRRRDNFGIRLL